MTTPPADTPPKPQAPPTDDAQAAPEGERIAKVIARAGVCSRREAEKLIAEGRVTVDGRVLESPALNVTGRETIVVDGHPLPAQEPTRLWRYYKEAGLVTTARDPEGRPTVFSRLPKDMPRVVSVGRLDVNTEGLLLLTNDGELARLLELPSTGWTRRYRARAHGRVTQADLDKLKNGVTVEGVRYGPVEAVLDKAQGSNVWITLSLKEGKNREVKKVLGSLGLAVNRLIRLSYGPFQCGDLQPGEVRVVPNRVLMDQLGNNAAKFGGKLPSGGAAKETNTNSRQGKPAGNGRKPSQKGGGKPGGKTGGARKTKGGAHAHRRRRV
ncbi:23S rRNA pseudouridine2605 synthase [Parvibaculum indicum]|uniref:pseudouridine synthase n=1 Tax=Parvibaculum indicum TaxID=562969 RepID=UPI0014202DAA|nr:pseudouridine synthase [Parvibaculum indicum]NIJ41794.1 23S rRNA pseudouridine2605 synthase [Parvibaculum indicum]